MKILYVSYYFPPFNTMGGIRARGQVLELMNQGHDVLVITAKYQGKFSKNLGLDPNLQILFFGNEVVDSNDDVTKQTRNSFKQKLLSLSKSNTFINFLFTFRLLIEEMIGYKAKWKKQIIKNYQKIEDWGPDLIFGSYSPWSSILVSRKLSSKLGIKWYAEMRDSFSFNPVQSVSKRSDFYSKFLSKFEKYILSSASGIICATDFVYFYYQTITKNKRFIKIYNGSDSGLSPGTSKLTNSQKINITHCGSLLYGQKNPYDLLEVIAENKTFRNNYYLNFFGYSLESLDEFVKEREYYDFISIGSVISYDDALATARDSDINLLIMLNHDNEKYSVTGKIFELINHKNQILMINGKGSEAEKVILSTEIPYCCAESKEDIKKFLETFLKKAHDNPLNSITIKPITRKNEIAKLINFLGQN